MVVRFLTACVFALCLAAPLAAQEAERAATEAEIAEAVAKAQADPAAVKAFEPLLALEQAAAAGAPSDDPFVERFHRYLAPAEATPFLRELGQRAARDQFWRLVRAQPVFREAMAQSSKVSTLAAGRGRQVDDDNTAWLKAELDRRKAWPKISEIGERGSSNIWLLVQHADRAPDVQKQALELMAPLLSSREVSKQDHAYLFDRVAVHAGRPQRYGTQIDCSGRNGGPAAMNGLEDAARVDVLRAEAGIRPVKLADYLSMAPFCRAGSP